jgi:hypothetical protein
MKIKKALAHFFNDLLDYWNKEYGTYPKAAWDEEIDPLLYLSNPDEEEYVYWKPIEKKDLENFSEIERILDLKIHDSIKEYFNSYWFLNLQGFYDSRLISLEPVEPCKQVLEFFKAMKHYEESKGRKHRYLHIGFISPEDMAVIVDNETGKVFIEDFETEKYELLEDSLVDLINNMNVQRN